ncbi:MAG: hypothetical protein QGI45_06490 [Myxococcota bacterium]|jgi:cytochrome c oxidase subunit 2|nr:hypothetical protein [Myxococcota bacterium]
MLDSLPLENISTFGADVDAITAFVWWIIVGWGLAAEAIFIWFLIIYRKKDGVRAAWTPATTLRSTAWVLVPTFIVLLFDLVIEHRSAPIWDTIKDPAQIPQHEVLVRIRARQFAWDFTYAGEDGKLDTADDFTSMSELRVPRNKVVRFQLESLDVIHSFWVPVLRLKQDIVPGRFIPGWFEATTDGEYEIACAEICGASHTQMRALLVVESAEKFAKWAATQVEQNALTLN